MYQDSAYTKIEFYSLSSTNAGYPASGAGTLIINIFSRS
jgi:hypothetical protein